MELCMQFIPTDLHADVATNVLHLIHISLTEPLSFTINGSELPTVSIINNYISLERHKLLCAGTKGNRQLQLHVNTTEISDLTPLYNISSQNYSAAIEITINKLPPLFISTLTCTSIESGETVSLILTSSEYIATYVDIVCTFLIIYYIDTFYGILKREQVNKKSFFKAYKIRCYEVRSLLFSVTITKLNSANNLQ